MPAFIDLTGEQYGMLTVLERATSKNGRSRWLVRCDCGAERIVYANDLRRGQTRSCNGHRDAPNKTHGKEPIRLWDCWCNMRRRCIPGHPMAKYYADRGITVCPEWQASFEVFRDWALANGYRDDLTIDRKENDKGYEPGNCQWATAREQRLNQRRMA